MNTFKPLLQELFHSKGFGTRDSLLKVTPVDRGFSLEQDD